MSDETPETADQLAVRDDMHAEQQPDESKSAPADRAEAGPFDLAEVPSMRPYVDLGGIKVAPREGLQMRLEVDERAKRVIAVTIDYQGSVLQMQAFSAPKTTGLWNSLRAEMRKQLSSQGAEMSEDDGALGPELVMKAKVAAEQGGGTRTLRFIGVDGPRWLLRGVIMGAGATDAEARARVIEVFRETVVVRGEQPMPPNELLALKVPAGVNAAQRGPGEGGPGPSVTGQGAAPGDGVAKA